MNRPALLAIGTAAAVLIATGCSGTDAPRVQVGAVTRTDVAEVVDAPGVVMARATTTLSAPADGTVLDVLVKDGQQVRAGAVLLRLSSPSAQDRLRQALAASAGLSRPGADPLLAGAAAAAVTQARATVDALSVRAPFGGTVTLGGPPASGNAGSGLSGLVSQLPPAVQGQAQQALGGSGSTAQTSIDSVDAGAPVTTGLPLLTVTDLSRLSVLAEVDETDVLLVKPGTPATIEVDAVPDATYKGEVSSVELAPTTSARGGVSYRVRVTLQPGRTADDSPAAAPRPGMSAVVNLAVRSATAVLSVPSAAVVRVDGKDAVFVISDGKARARPIVVGANGIDRVEVLRGLSEGDRIVVRDGDRLRDGQSVRT